MKKLVSYLKSNLPRYRMLRMFIIASIAILDTFVAFAGIEDRELITNGKISIPPMMVFGKVKTNGQKEIPYTITNSQQANFKIDSMIFRGNDSEEFKIVNITFPLVVESGKDATLQAVFHPKKDGIKDVKLFVYSSSEIVKGEIGVSAEAYTDVTKSETEKVIPAQFYLSQNYPNPFNPTTKVIYQVPVRSRVKISLLNISGQIVNTYTDAFKDPGTYEIELRFEDMPSGIYFYMLQTNNYSITKKCVLIK